MATASDSLPKVFPIMTHDIEGVFPPPLPGTTAFEFDAIFHKAIANWTLTGPEERFLDAVTKGRGLDRNLPLSNMYVRQAAQKAMGAVWREHALQADLPAHRRYFFATLVWDAGTTYEDAPEANIKALQLAAYKALHTLDLHGLGVVEVDHFKKRFDGEAARRISFQIHAIVWTDDPMFKPVKAGAKLSSSRRFSHDLGAPGVVFTPFHKDQTLMEALVFLSNYVLKAPVVTKNPVPSRKKPGRYKLRTDRKGFTKQMAVTMMEIWSQITAVETVFGIGEGKHLRKAYLRVLMANLKRRAGRQKDANLDPDGMRAMWQAMRDRNQKEYRVAFRRSDS